MRDILHMPHLGLEQDRLERKQGQTHACFVLSIRVYRGGVRPPPRLRRETPLQTALLLRVIPDTAAWLAPA